MKERPILFSAPMVRALLDGTKTQTRRVVKCHTPKARSLLDYTIDGVRVGPCPYGQPGDRLWVRETWQGPLLDLSTAETTDDWRSFEKPQFCAYAADGGPTPEFVDADDNLMCRWRPSIHMPRWASRISLEVTGVRVERLHNISRGDAMSEGCPFPNMADGDDPRRWYAELWKQINGADSWLQNPWVWVVEFKRLEGGAA